MTKSTSPAGTNAGLPAIDRRSLVCGLGTAAIAGVPALALFELRLGKLIAPFGNRARPMAPGRAGTPQPRHAIEGDKGLHKSFADQGRVPQRLCWIAQRG